MKNKELGFRPHQGIILFNFAIQEEWNAIDLIESFRPHQGIILFNKINYYNCF